MLQTGLIKKWKSRYWPQKDKCSSTSGLVGSDSNRTVKLGDMQGSFYLLFFGLFIALIILTGEIYLYRRRKKRMITDTTQIIVDVTTKAKDAIEKVEDSKVKDTKVKVKKTKTKLDPPQQKQYTFLQ